MKNNLAVLFLFLLPLSAWSLEWKNSTDSLRENSTVFKSLSYRNKSKNVTFEFGMTRVEAKEDRDEVASQYAYYPSIFMKGDKAPSRYIDLSQNFESYAWEEVYLLAEKELIFGILEFSVEGPSESLLLIRGDLKNNKWEEIKIPKPRYTAQFKSFEMNAAGLGQILLEDPTGSACIAEKKFEGAESILVEVKTKDFGKKWLLPKNCASARGNFLRTLERIPVSNETVKCEDYRNIFWSRNKEIKKVPQECRPQ